MTKPTDSEMELRRCPFCGWSGRVMHMLDGFLVECDWYNHRIDGGLPIVCLIGPVSRGHESREAAIEAWNTRTEAKTDERE